MGVTPTCYPHLLLQGIEYGTIINGDAIRLKGPVWWAILLKAGGDKRGLLLLGQIDLVNVVGNGHRAGIEGTLPRLPGYQDQGHQNMVHGPVALLRLANSGILQIVKPSEERGERRLWVIGRNRFDRAHGNSTNW